MKKIVFLMITLSYLIFLTGCRDNGVLRIYNQTAHTTNILIENSEYQIDPNSSLNISWSLSNSIFGVEERTIHCRIFDRLFLFGERFQAKITAGATTNKIIRNNAAGLEIKNNSFSFYITAVYISPADDSFWGGNKLTGQMGPRQFSQWNLTQGFWDIKVVDNYGDEFFFWDQVFVIGNLNIYNYTGFRTFDNEDEFKAEKAKGNLYPDVRVEAISQY